jgi:DNA-binding transcriptional regulator LsrR (DeoR family)
MEPSHHSTPEEHDMSPTQNPSPADAPKLEGWITTTELAQRLGLSRQAVSRAAWRRTYASLSTVGDKPVLVVSEEEARALEERYAARRAGVRDLDFTNPPEVSE